MYSVLIINNHDGKSAFEYMRVTVKNKILMTSIDQTQTTVYTHKQPQIMLSVTKHTTLSCIQINQLLFLSLFKFSFHEIIKQTRPGLRFIIVA